MDYVQISIFFLQGTIVSFLILLLFNLRRILGIGVLFACLGLFQFMQVFLSSTLYVEIAPNFLVSPGSSVLFTSTLFAVLLIYIKEDASETRKIIYTLLIVNIVMSVIIQTFGWNIKESSTYNPFNVSTNLFNNSAWVLLVGTLVLFLDTLLIIIIYESTSRYLSSLFLRIFSTMLIVSCFDTIFFSIIAFWNYENLSVIITSGIISKGIFAAFYSFIFFIYLKYFEKSDFDAQYFKLNDIFQTLSFREKYEIAKQEAIKTSEEVEFKEIQYKKLTDILPVGVFKTHIDGFTTFVNPKWCEISGLGVSEAVGNGWLKAVHPADIEQVKQGWETATTQKIISETEYRFLLKDGSIKWVLGRAEPEFDNENQLIGYVGTITDITERKRSEEELIRLSRAVKQSPVSVIITDQEGLITYVNEKFCEVTGYSSEEMLGQNPRIFKSGHHDQNFYKEFWDSIKSGNEWKGEMLNKKKNGELYWESALISPLVNKNGEIINFVAIKEDITEKKRIQEELLNAKLKAEEMNKLKSFFLANMSHELRTPFVGIMGYTELLYSEIEDEDHKEMLNGILNTSKRMLATLNNILILTDIEFDGIELNITTILLKDVLESLLTEYNEPAAQKGIQLIINNQYENLIFNSDERLFREILSNLLNNAIKYTEAGKVEIEASIENQGVQKLLIIKVIDTGIGIPKDKHKSIFEEFRQVSEGKTRNFQGSGLGLSITRKMINKLGGTISVVSEIGEGSTFILSLPVEVYEPSK